MDANQGLANTPGFLDPFRVKKKKAGSAPVLSLFLLNLWGCLSKYWTLVTAMQFVELVS
jgi:hypothetical protein